MSDDEEISKELVTAGVALNQAMKRAREAGIDVRMYVKDFSTVIRDIDLDAWGICPQIVVSGSRTKTTDAW